MLPQEELPILEALVNIKHRLTALKKDTTSFIRARDVMSIYHQVAKEVNKLNAVRDRQNFDSMGLISGSSASALSSSGGDSLGTGSPARRGASVSRANSSRGEREGQGEGAGGVGLGVSGAGVGGLGGSGSGAGRPRYGEDAGGRKVSDVSAVSSKSDANTAKQTEDDLDGESSDDEETSSIISDESYPNNSAFSTPNEEYEGDPIGISGDRIPPPRMSGAGGSRSSTPARSPQPQFGQSNPFDSVTTPDQSPRKGSAPIDLKTPKASNFRLEMPDQTPPADSPINTHTNTSTPTPPEPDNDNKNVQEQTPTQAQGSQPPSTSAEEEMSSQLESQHISQVEVKPPTETNRVDQVLNDVFGLLSLFFLTIGKVKESPGVFCQIASMRQFLDHMQESGVYTQQDLQPFLQRLTVLKSIIKNDREEGRHPDGVIKLMLRKWEDCERLLQTLLKSLSVLSVELVPIHQRLVHIRRQVGALAAQLKVEKKDIKPLVEELRKIDSSRVDGKFLGPGGTSVPAGQAILVGLIEECFEIIQDIRAREGAENVAPPLKPVWERLTEIRAKLERLQLTHRWTLRETDLYNYAQALREVDMMRVDGSFVDAEGNKAEGQYVLLYLLRRCHGLIYRLIAESEPISEELQPIANKLSTIKKCLNEVMKYGGPFSARDLYPYHLALHQIDSIRKDGKFLSEDGTIPEGQAILVAQLSEAHELLEMLKDNMGEESDEDEDDEDYDEDEDEQEYAIKPAAPLDATPRVDVSVEGKGQ